LRHIKVGRTAGVHGDIYPTIKGRERIRRGGVLAVRHDAILSPLDRGNLTVTFPEHYSSVRMSTDASGLVLIFVIIGVLPFVVICFVDRFGEDGTGARIDRELGHRYGCLAAGLQYGKGGLFREPEQ
jgi:hypothetical protein